MSRLHKIAFFLFFATIFVYAINSIGQVDTFYHIKTGGYVWQTKSVPTHDIFSLTALGNKWIPHEWLAQLIFYFIHRAAGIAGLMAFSAFLAALTYWMLLRTAIRRNAHSFLTPLVLFILGYLTLELWVPRPQIFGFLGLVLLLYVLEKYRDNFQKKYLAWSMGIVWLWANIHASFILGLVVLFWYFFAEQIKLLTPKIFGTNGLNQKAANWLGAGALSAATIALANPSGYKVFLYNFYVRDTAAVLNVAEWQPITLFFQNDMAKIFITIFVLADIFLITRFVAKETRDLTSLGLVVGISILPFISIRHVGFWPLVAAPLFAGTIAPIAAKIEDLLGVRRAIAILAGLFLLFLGGRYFTFPRTRIDPATTPVKAVDFIESSGLRGPFFNLYNEGGYLIWRLWPKEKVFIDGRSEVYGPKQLNEFFTIIQGKPGWEDLIDKKYKLNYFLLTYQPQSLMNAVGPLTSVLFKKHFVLVYWDGTRIILVRDTPENAGIIQKFGMRHINPFRDPAQIPVPERQETAIEIQSLLEREPNSDAVRGYAAKFLFGSQ